MSCWRYLPQITESCFSRQTVRCGEYRLPGTDRSRRVGAIRGAPDRESFWRLLQDGTDRRATCRPTGGIQCIHDPPPRDPTVARVPRRFISDYRYTGDDTASLPSRWRTPIRGHAARCHGTGSETEPLPRQGIRSGAHRRRCRHEFGGISPINCRRTRLPHSDRPSAFACRPGIAASQIDRWWPSTRTTCWRRCRPCSTKPAALRAARSPRGSQTFDLKGGPWHDAGSARTRRGCCMHRRAACRRCDMMICAAGQRHVDLTAFEALSRFDLLAGSPGEPFKRSRRFVRARDAAPLALKRLSDAERDGDEVLAIIHGAGRAAIGGKTDAAFAGCLRAGLEGGQRHAQVAMIDVLGAPLDLARVKSSGSTESLVRVPWIAPFS